MTRAIPPSEDTPAGFGYALAAYLFWWVLPLYMKLLSHIPPAEVVAHRIVWSVPIAGRSCWCWAAPPTCAPRSPRPGRWRWGL